MKGQVSIETLFLLIVIITITAYVASLFIQTQDTTNAYIVLRAGLLEQTNLKENEVIIQEITFTGNETPTFQIKTIPNTLTNADFNIEKLIESVEKNSKYQNVSIKIN